MFIRTLKHNQYIILLSAIFTLLPGLAMATTLHHIVEPQDNLFYDAWGHAYDEVFNIHDITHLEHPENYALGAGVRARAVSDASGVFNFSGYDSVDISASGWIQDDRDLWTDVNGYSEFSFRGAPAYSLIGIWSLDPETINPAFGADSVLAIGSGLTLNIPDLTDVYLFLAENDGWFFDNGKRRQATNDKGELIWENFYDVTLDLAAAQVSIPEPSVLALLIVAMLGWSLIKSNARRQSKIEKI